jgi:hypothetical protein
MCVCVCHVSIAADRHIKTIFTITNQQLSKQVRCSIIIYVERGTGDFLSGLIFSDVRVNNHFRVVRRLRASGAVTVLACRCRILYYFSCQNCISGNVFRPVIAIFGDVQFVMDVNTEVLIDI